MTRAEQCVPCLLEAGREAAAPLQAFETPIETGLPTSSWTPRIRSTSEASPVEGTRRSARQESSRRSNEGSRSRGRERLLDRLVGGRHLDDDVRCDRGRSRAAWHALRAAPRTLPPASCSKKSLIRFFSVSRSISSIFLIATAVWFATARARSTSGVPFGADQPKELVVGNDRDGDAGSARSGQLRPELGEPDRRGTSCAGWSRSSEPELLRSRRRAGTGGTRGSSSSACSRDDRRERARRASRARAIVSASSVRCSSSRDPLARLLVQARILDRARDERGGRGEELDLLGRELARRLGVRA